MDSCYISNEPEKFLWERFKPSKCGQLNCNQLKQNEDSFLCEKYKLAKWQERSRMTKIYKKRGNMIYEIGTKNGDKLRSPFNKSIFMIMQREKRMKSQEIFNALRNDDHFISIEEDTFKKYFYFSLANLCTCGHLKEYEPENL